MNEQSKVKITIAFVSPNAWTMYNFRREMLQHILQSGYEVIVIAEQDNYTSLLTSMGCSFVPLVFNNRSLSPVDDVLLFFKLKKIYTTHRPDLIFHYVIKPNIYGTLAAGVLGIPSVPVITGLGHAFNKNSLLSGLIKLLYRFTLRYAHQVWCLNDDDANFFAANKIVPTEKIIVLPGEGVDTDYFQKQATTIDTSSIFTFLMSARLLKSKGIVEYSDAALLLHKRKTGFQCLLLGAIEDHPDAVSREHIKEWQQAHGLQYLGFTDDVRPHLSTADCFVYPSYYNEGVPRSLMEACSMKLPVITTDNTGCRELIEDDVNGYLCKKHDPLSLADQMQNMMELRAESRKIMGEKGREIVTRKYSVKKVIDFYSALLEKFFRV